MYDFGREEIDAVLRVLSGRRLFRYLEGAEEARRFEAELAARLGVPRALLLSSGTAGLICALAALGIGPGDEVAVPAYGFVADPLAVLAVGALPVVCDIDAGLTLDPVDLERRIGPSTRAVIAVHMNGFPCDLEGLSAVARRRRLVVVEDACQAIGGSYRGRPLGTLGEVGVFSFNQFKILTAGEGGAVVMRREDLYERAFLFHDGSCGNRDLPFTEAPFAGSAFRASEITAAILRAQLAKLDSILGRLRSSREALARGLAACPRLRPAPVHDQAGSCGTHLAYTLETEQELELVCRLARAAGVDAGRGDRWWHSYREWTLLHAGRGGHHPRRNPLDEAPPFDPAACPRSADLLARTVLFTCGIDADPEPAERLAEDLARHLE